MANDQKLQNTEIKFDKTPSNNPWDDIVESNFVKFEEKKSSTITFTNWELNKKEKKDFDGNMVIKDVLEADVIMKDGKEVTMKLGIDSKPFLLAVKPFVNGTQKTDKISVRVVKMGTGKATTYMIEKL